MTLGFKQEIKGVKNFFVAKIWMGLDIAEKQKMYDYYFDTHVYTLNKPFDVPDDVISAKLHTIRAGDRWRAGMDIHMVINNRTADRFQFAPTVKCKSVQKIEIKWKTEDWVYLYVDGRHIDFVEIEALAINDGFESVDAFFEYFNTDFTGQLIHWTDLKY
ncbi:hypothetical protein [Pedobacter zeae]|uniref:Uncharacterized protein n=1 Tax=Pedobacter zeae TaxID=1737356 RepID=A0A7W6P571_9SPHI|nr:hypothetical protein [Pedobacter zeae]MBB4106656.1 hypothetical protein [Pedobacter zeae]GGH02968.1 hypothetical protein GCM10007422_17730 [Pedobacter zeae]